MTHRSIIIGMLIVAALSLWCYFSDHVVRAGELVGNLMPAVLYGALVAVVLSAALLVHCTHAKRGLPKAELAAVLVLFLCACGIPGRFSQCMPSSIMLPHHDVRLRPGWRQENVVDLVPRVMLPDITRDESRVLNGFVTGLAEGDRHVRIRDVPWSGWTRTLAFWAPLMILITSATFGLAAVVHRQWSRHEQLPYPIAVFAHALIADDDQNGGALFRNRLFWAGLLFVFLIELNNYACRWWPQTFIPVVLRFDFSPLAPRLPLLVRGKGMALLYPRVLFPVLGLAYFLASDICLSMTIGPWIYCLIAGVFAGYGIELRPGKEMALSIEGFLYSGGYFGILLMVLYTGRHYYRSVLRCSIGARQDDTVPGYAVWGMRLFIAGAGLATLQLIAVGLAWHLALMYVFFTVMVYVVVSRIIAETGAFIIGTFVFPGVLLWGFFGAPYLGPKAMVTTFVLSTVLCLIPGRAPMGFIVQALRLAEMTEVNLDKTVRWGLAAMLLSFSLAVPVAIYWQYDRGTPNYGWPRKAATYPFENTVEAIHKLKAQGRYEQATQARGLQRLGDLTPSAVHIAAFTAAAALAVVFGTGRLVFRRWPLHPVIFLFLGGSAAMHMAFSFFLGWLIKFSAAKYGGARLYQKLKPLMIGLIAGAMLGQFVPLVVGTVRYLVLGMAPT